MLKLEAIRFMEDIAKNCFASRTVAKHDVPKKDQVRSCAQDKRHSCTGVLDLTVFAKRHLVKVAPSTIHIP